MIENQLSFDFNPPKEDVPELWTPDDIFKNCDKNIITSFVEDRRVERKRAEIKERDFADFVCMWANTQPYGGIIFLGLGSAKNDVIGCKHCDSGHLNSLQRCLSDLCPDAKVEYRRIEVNDNNGEQNFVEVFRVFYSENRLVETSSKDAFVREGDSKRKLSESEKREFRLNRGEMSFELEDWNGSFPDDFNGVLVKEFVENFKEQRNLKLEYSDEQILSLAKLGRLRDGKFLPNNACGILFSDNLRTELPGAYIRILRYKGTKETFGQEQEITFDKLIEGPLSRQIQEAESHIFSQNRNVTRLSESGKFEKHPEYPDDVLLEALVNATVHRSYNLKNMNIFVKIFADRVVVESPGNFFPPTSAATVYDAHNPRNPHLMWAMYYLGRVQCAFEGTRRMRNSMRQMNLPDPVFRETSSSIMKVSVTLRNNVHKNSGQVTDRMSEIFGLPEWDDLDDVEKFILVSMSRSGRQISIAEMSLLTGNSVGQMKEVANSLLKKNLFSYREGEGLASRYSLITRVTDKTEN